MDNRVSVEGYGPMSSLSLASRSLRVIALAAALALTACGGGGGGGDDGGGNPPPPDPDTGQIAATVVDQFDAPINGVTITAAVAHAPDHGVRRDGHSDTGTDRLGQCHGERRGTRRSARPDGHRDVRMGPRTSSSHMQRVTEATGGISRAVPEDR